MPDDSTPPASDEMATAATADAAPVSRDDTVTATKAAPLSKPEYGGPKGLEPTRYGDWERNGRCCDF